MGTGHNQDLVGRPRQRRTRPLPYVISLVCTEGATMMSSDSDGSIPAGSTRTADTLYSGHFELSSALDDRSELIPLSGK